MAYFNKETKSIIPLEADEQKTFVQWLELNQLKFTAIPNSTWTPSGWQLLENIAMGVRPGFPDLLVIIPAEKSKTKKACILCVEMKRIKGYAIKEKQKSWINAINTVENVEARICFGADQAIGFVSEFLRVRS
jgi:hypothetical protein